MRAEARARQKDRIRGRHPQGCLVLLPGFKSTCVDQNPNTRDAPLKRRARQNAIACPRSTSEGTKRGRTQNSVPRIT